MSLSFAHSLRRLDSWQQRSPALGIPVAVIKKFIDDGADRLGVQIGYWGFFSIFALLLVFASILGFVFESNPDLQHQLVNSTLERIPVIGPQISGDIGTLTGSGLALTVGVVGALWTGLGVTLAIGTALDRTWDVPPLKRAGFVNSRLRGLLVLASVGAVNVLATVAVGLATAGGVGTVVTQVLSFLASAVIDLVLFAASFRVLTAAQVTTRQVLPGALLAAGCWLGLQALGGVFVTKVLAGSSQTYGGFAAVIGLLSWLLIASELILIAAELNVVLARRLWPRSLTGALLEADKQALRDSAHAAQLDPRQHIAVKFGHCNGEPNSGKTGEKRSDQDV
ncbi:MAG: YihY/virulence factor BrkB family protein [Solirubrobacteraceae bacterium]